MTGLQSTVAVDPCTDLAKEILAVCRQFCLLMRAPDGFVLYQPVPEFFSLPQLPELAAAANVALASMGRNVDSVDMLQAEALALALPLNDKRDRADMPPPMSAAELSELLDRLIARLETVAWGHEALKAMGQWCNENPDQGTQVCTALRLIARYSASNFYCGRD